MQITHCVPVLIAVLVANAIAHCLAPSCYDSIIMIKKLPYLPDILPSSSTAYNIYVEDFMLRDVFYIWYAIQCCRERIAMSKEIFHYSPYWFEGHHRELKKGSL